MKRLLCRVFICWFAGHKWICRTMEGELPTEEDMPSYGDDIDTLLGKFARYSTMYCRRCRKISRKSIL